MAAKPKRRAGYDLLLPPEIWREILSILPAKSVLRCRSVCKSWYSLVSCPKFMSDYTTRNLNKNPNHLLLQLHDNGEHVCSFTSHDDESFAEFRDHHDDDSPRLFRGREHDEVPEAFLGSQVNIVGSCNGLICLSKHECIDDVEVIKFVIWNPTIRKIVELPSRNVCCKTRHYSYYGFGFDSKTGDYKVMFTHSVRTGSRTKKRRCSYVDSNANMCEVFDLRKGVWRGISPLMHSWNIWTDTPECYLNGAVHWTGSTHDRSPDRIILSFDMSDEVFREIKMPDCEEFIIGNNDFSSMKTRTMTLGGLIHVMVCTWDGNYTCYMDEDSSVWVMKEYGVTESWTKLFNIESQIAVLYLEKLRLWENGQVLMVRRFPENTQELVLYDVESRNYILLFSFAKRVSDMCLYKESLVLM